MLGGVSGTNGLRAWIASGVGGRARVTSITRLGPVVDAVVVEVGPDRRRERLVLRRAHEDGMAAREVAALTALARCDVPVPEVVAADLDRGWVLVRRLPGKSRWAPPGRMAMDAWLTGLAEMLPRIHVVPGDGFRPYRAFYLDAGVEVPRWSRRPRMWERAIAVWRGPAPDEGPVHLVHRDYHPGNVLWARSKVSGVVDWVEASAGTPGVDLGHCRLNLALTFDAGVADRFYAAWQSAAGRPYAELDPYWDLAAAVAFDLLDLPVPSRSHLESFVGAAVARL